MSDELDFGIEDEGTEGQESEVIRTLRAKERALKAELKEAKLQAQSALAEARLQLERESAAQRLMGHAGYPGLTDTILEKVEGDVTPEKVLHALTGLKLTVNEEAFWQKVKGQPVESEKKPVENVADDVADVASLGNKISAATQNAPELTIADELEATKTFEEIVAWSQRHGVADNS